MSDKTPEQIVEECANAAIACWNHYSQAPLSEEYSNKVKAAVSEALPATLYKRPSPWREADRYVFKD